MFPKANSGEYSVSIIKTEDGSHSLFVPQINETYHSRHGAVQESKHVFIQHGLFPVLEKFSSPHILEIGFGTGLNALLTASAAEKAGQQVRYTTLETFPLESNIVRSLNYTTDSEKESGVLFNSIHECEWEHMTKITDFFEIDKRKIRVQDFIPENKFHLIYYDAFGPPTQPEMWDKNIFIKMFDILEHGGILVTYCAKGQVRRDLQSSGFIVERLQGPPGKREMLRATKP